MAKVKYPEHEKLHKVHEQSQVIGEFLEQLGSEGLSICEYVDRHDRWSPLSKNTEKILADYFGIDLDKLEKEKRQMLAELQKANK